MPEYSPSSLEFKGDPGITPLAKYISGLVMVQQESGINDITRFINAKEAKNIFKRAAHNMFTDRDYV